MLLLVSKEAETEGYHKAKPCRLNADEHRRCSVACSLIHRMAKDRESQSNLG